MMFGLDTFMVVLIKKEKSNMLKRIQMDKTLVASLQWNSIYLTGVYVEFSSFENKDEN